MHDIVSMPREKQDEAVWLTAYVRALQTVAPVNAEIVAIDALRRFRSRWIGVSVPEGIDPRVYAASRRHGENTDAEFEARLAKESDREDS